MPCPHPVGFFENEHGVRIPAPCKRWDCPHCGVVKKAKLLDRVAKGFNYGGFRVRHLTLTELKEPDNPEAELISKHWARLRATLAKKGYHKFRFFWTKELKRKSCEYCKSNCEFVGSRYRECTVDLTLYYHMHTMIPVYIPQVLLSKAWWKATNHTAYIVYINKQEIRTAAGYLSKYLSKDFTTPAFKKHERRYGFSKGFPVEQWVSDSDEVWTFTYKPNYGIPEKVFTVGDYPGVISWQPEEFLYTDGIWLPINFDVSIFKQYEQISISEVNGVL